MLKPICSIWHSHFKVKFFLPCWISKPKSNFSYKNWIKKLFFKFCQIFFEFSLGLRTADFLFSICHISSNTMHRDILSLGLLRSLCCKHIMIVNDSSSIINKWHPQFGAPLTDDAWVIIYDRNMFVIQATGGNRIKL